jgi:hypothetical protein
VVLAVPAFFIPAKNTQGMKGVKFMIFKNKKNRKDSTTESYKHLQKLEEAFFNRKKLLSLRYLEAWHGEGIDDEELYAEYSEACELYALVRKVCKELNIEIKCRLPLVACMTA